MIALARGPGGELLALFLAADPTPAGLEAHMYWVAPSAPGKLRVQLLDEGTGKPVWLSNADGSRTRFFPVRVRDLERGRLVAANGPLLIP